MVSCCPLRIGLFSYQMTCWMLVPKKLGDGTPVHFNTVDGNEHLGHPSGAGFFPSTVWFQERQLCKLSSRVFTQQVSDVFVFEKSCFCFDSSQRVGFRQATPRNPWVHPPKLRCPLKGTISAGKKTSSNHWFSTDMLVFRGVGPVPKTSN